MPLKSPFPVLPPRPGARAAGAIQNIKHDDASEKEVQQLIAFIESRLKDKTGIKEPANAEIKALVTALESDDAKKREAAKKELTAIITKHVKALGSEEFEERQTASATLADIGYPATAALRQVLNDPDLEVSYRAEALFEPLREINSRRAGSLENPAGRLIQMGPDAKAALPALIKALETVNAAEDKNDAIKVRAKLAKAIGTIGATEAAVPALIEALGSDDTHVKDEAAFALGSAGPAAKTAVPALTQALKDENIYVRRNAAHALGKTGVNSPQVTAGLITALDDKNDTVRSNAVSALAKMKPRPIAALPALRKLAANDEYLGIKLSAIQLIGNFGPDGAPAVPELKAALTHTDPRMRLAAIEALGNIGPAAKEATADLANLIKENKPLPNSYDEALNEKARSAAIPLLNKLQMPSPGR